MADPAEGKPGKQVMRGESGNEVRRFAGHRIASLVHQAFDEMERERGAGKRDYVARLVEAYHADPLAWLERARKLTEEQQPGAGKVTPMLSMQALFVQAAREVAAMPASPAAPMASMLELAVEPSPDAASAERANTADNEIVW